MSRIPRRVRHNDDDAIGLEQDFHDSRYRKMLLRAWAAAAAYSVQWKLGPLNEGTIGHVGLHTDPTYGTNRTGLNDYVLDSFGGIPLMIVEDAGDKYAAQKWEARVQSKAGAEAIRVL